MFPNPQDALPLPPSPQIQQYKKLAKDLAEIVRSSDSNGIELWFEQWFAQLDRLSESVQPKDPALAAEDRSDSITLFAQFAKSQIPSSGSGALAAAQFVLARAHGFPNWARFVETLDRLAHTDSTEALFELAADSIVNGDRAKLEKFLHRYPELIRARSARAHRATLLHYLGANGVENYRQKTPANAVQIADLLLDLGAEVDSAAEIYGGGATTFGLVATSGHPVHADVQIPLMQTLLSHGADINGSTAPSASPLIHVCLANNRVQAAEFLASQGAELDLASSAGLGRIDDVKRILYEKDREFPSAGSCPVHAQLPQAFHWACSYNRVEVVQYLLNLDLDLGIDLGIQDRFGQTGLHHAAMSGHPQVIRLLIDRKAPLEIENSYGGTPLGQALWSAAHDRDPDRYLPAIQLLLQAGSRLPDQCGPISPAIDRLLAAFSPA